MQFRFFALTTFCAVAFLALFAIIPNFKTSQSSSIKNEGFGEGYYEKNDEVYRDLKASGLATPSFTSEQFPKTSQPSSNSSRINSCQVLSDVLEFVQLDEQRGYLKYGDTFPCVSPNGRLLFTVINDSPVFVSNGLINLDEEEFIVEAGIMYSQPVNGQEYGSAANHTPVPETTIDSDREADRDRDDIATMMGSYVIYP